MPAVAKALTSLPSRLIALQVLLLWVLQGERPAREAWKPVPERTMIAQPLTAVPGLRRPQPRTRLRDIPGSEPASKQRNR
jgi:hypothetical protein